MVMPPATKIPSNLTVSDVEFAILNTVGDVAKNTSTGMDLTYKLLSYGLGGNDWGRRQYWFYEGKEDNSMLVSFHYKVFYFQVRLTYGGDYIQYEITESRNLKQSGNKIHRNTLVWLSGLERNIKASLGRVDRHKYLNKIKS
jgi:hypothetical protein